jgi:hypothetical protein
MDLQLPDVDPESTNIHDVEFYLIANAASILYENNPISLSENTTKAELEALKFTGIVQSSSLPLYCKKTEKLDVASYKENTAEGHKGHMILAQTAECEMTRSFAKVSVY